MIRCGFLYVCDASGCDQTEFTDQANGPAHWATFKLSAWSAPANVCPTHAKAMHHQDTTQHFYAPALLIEPYPGASSE